MSQSSKVFPRNRLSFMNYSLNRCILLFYGFCQSGCYIANDFSSTRIFFHLSFLSTSNTCERVESVLLFTIVMFYVYVLSLLLLGCLLDFILYLYT